MKLGYQNLSQQSGGRNSLVNDMGWHRRPDQRLACLASPFAAHMSFDPEHARQIVELLADVFAYSNALVTTCTGQVVRLMKNGGAWQLRKQWCAFGLLPWLPLRRI